jgi:hypothetical protein
VSGGQANCAAGTATLFLENDPIKYGLTGPMKPIFYWQILAGARSRGTTFANSMWHCLQHSPSWSICPAQSTTPHIKKAWSEAQKSLEKYQLLLILDKS